MIVTGPGVLRLMMRTSKRTRKRVYSRFAVRSDVTFFPEIDDYYQDEYRGKTGRRPAPAIAKRLRDPKFRRLAKALVILATYNLLPAFESLRRSGVNREKAAETVVRRYRRRIE